MASKNPPAVPRRRYADFCNKICQQQTHASQQTASLFVDHRIGACKQRRWYDEAERLGSLEVDHQLILDWGLDRKLARHLPLEDAIDIARGKPKYIALLASIGQQAAFFSEETPRIDGRKIIASSLQDDLSATNV